MIFLRMRPILTWPRFAFARLRGHDVAIYRRGPWALTEDLVTDYLWVRRGAFIVTSGYRLMVSRHMVLDGTVSNPHIYTVRREHTMEGQTTQFHNDVYWVAKGASGAVDWMTAPLFIARHQGREVDGTAKQRAEALAALLNAPRDYA